MKRYDALIAANKEAVDAVSQINSVFTNGLQEISSQICAIAQSTVELNLETSRAAATIKSPQELAELQSKWVRQLFKTALSGSAKLTEIANRIAHQASEPVQSQICNTVSRMADNAAQFTHKDA